MFTVADDFFLLCGTLWASSLSCCFQALRFPMHMKREELETDEQRAERESAEAELMAQLDEDDDGEGDDM